MLMYDIKNQNIEEGEEEEAGEEVERQKKNTKPHLAISSKNPKDILSNLWSTCFVKFFLLCVCVVHDCVFARTLKGFGMWMFCSGCTNGT